MLSRLWGLVVFSGLRIFVYSRLMLLLLVIGLSVTLLLSSSMVMVQMYINNSVNRVLEGMEYHSLLYIGSNTTSYNPLTGIIENNSIASYVDRLDVEATVIKTVVTKSLLLEAGNKTVDLYNDNTTLYIVVSKMFRKPYLLFPLSSYRLEGVSKAVIASLELEVVDRNSLVDYIGVDSYKCISWAIDTLSFYDDLKKISKIALLIPSNMTDYVIDVLDSYVEYSLWTANSMKHVLPDTIEFPRTEPDIEVKLRSYVESFNKYIHEFLERQSSYYSISLISIKYKPRSVVYSISMSLSILRSVSIEDRVYKIITKQGLIVAPQEIKLPEVFNNMVSYESVSRFTALFSTLPSIVIVWIVSEKTPPVIIALMRKTIALMRIRGLQLARVKKYFMASSIVLGLTGFVIGLFLGPLLAIIVYGGDYSGYYTYLPLVVNPLNILIVASITVGVIATSIWRNFSVIEKIPPREFTKPLLYSELAILKTGMGKTGWVSIAFGVYFIARIMRFIDPYEIYMYYGGSPAVLIIAVILLMLEPVTLLLGPVLLVYGIAKLLIAYPKYTIKVIEYIVKPFTQEYSRLTSKLLYTKPARITLAIISISFSLSILLGGLLSSLSVSHTMNELKYVVSGSNYVIAKPIIVDSVEAIDSMLEHIYRVVDKEESTQALMVIGPIFSSNSLRNLYKLDLDYGVYRNSMWFKPYRIYVDGNELRLNYVLFIDSSKYYRILNIPDTLLFSGNVRDVFNKLRSGVALFVSNGSSYNVIGDYTIYSIIVNDTSVESINTGYKIDIEASLRNLPSIYSIVECTSKIPGIYTSVFSGLFSTSITFMVSGDIPVMFMDPGVILDMGSIESFIKINNMIYSSSNGYQGLFIIAYVFTSDELDENSICYLESNGFTVYSSREVVYRIDNVEDFLEASFSQSISTGLILYSIAIIVSLILVYTSLYEDLYTYALVRVRGVSSNIILRITLSEVVAITLIGIIPGILLGIVLGSGLSNMFFTSIVTMVHLPGNRVFGEIYGSGFRIFFTPSIILYLLAPIVLIICLNIVVIILSHRRVLRETLSLFSSRV